jgi:hypothetical protein
MKGLRSNEPGNPNPIRFNEDRAYTTSEPVKTYLLCEDCEQRFRHKGEDWVTANCYLPDGSFRVREALGSSTPVKIHDGITIYSGRSIPTIDCDALIYFGLSVLWRAAAHPWPNRTERAGITLGPYLEPIRRFLLDGSSFPQNTALAVRVSTLEDFLPVVLFPKSTTKQGFHVHRFVVAGLGYFLGTGQLLTQEFAPVQLAPSPERFITMNPQSESDEMRALSKIAKQISRRIK